MLRRCFMHKYWENNIRCMSPNEEWYPSKITVVLITWLSIKYAVTWTQLLVSWKGVSNVFVTNSPHNTFIQVILHKTQCNRMSLNFLDRKFYNRNSRLRSPHRKPLHAQHHKASNHLSNTGLINSATYDTNINLRILNSCQKKAVTCTETS
jgi:hypothetical protein